VLVDRERERAAIRRGLDGQGRRVVVITGVPGIGASSLLRETIADRGERVLMATGNPAGAAIPYGAVRTLFAPIARAHHEGEMPFDGPGAVLHRLAVGAPPSGDPGAMIYALQWVLTSLADDRGVLLALDDVHWFDEPSADALGAVLAHTVDERILVVATLRETGERDALATARSLRTIADEIVTPGPLGLDGVAALLGPRASEAARVLERSGGVPFVVAELAAALADGDQLTASPRVLESIAARLSRLGPDATAVARAIAVLGPEATSRRTAALSPIPLSELDRVVVGLIGEGIVAEHRRDGVLALAHPIVADAVVAGVGPIAMQDARGRAARILLDDGLPAARAVGVLLLDDPADDPWRAEVLATAAREALAGGAAATAVALLERAELESPAPTLRRELRSLLGAALLMAGSPVEAAAVLERDDDADVPSADRVRRLMGLGDARYAAAEFGAAQRAYRDAIDTIDGRSESETALTIESTTRLAIGSLTVDPLADVIPDALVRSITDRPTEADGPAERRLLAAAALSASARLRWDLDPGALAERALHDGAIAIEGFADDPTTYLLTGALYLDERYASAIGLLDRAVEDASRRDRAASEMSARFTRGAITIIGGALPAGLDDLEAAVGLGRLSAAPHHLYSVSASALLVRYSRMVGDLERAEAVLAHLSHERLLGSHLAIAHLATAEHHLHTGAPELALRDAARARDLDDDGILAWTFSWRTITAAASLELGDRERAVAVNTDELEVLRHRRVPTAARLDAMLLAARLAPDAVSARAILADFLDTLAIRHAWQRAMVEERIALIDLDAGLGDAAAERLLGVLRTALDQGIAPLEHRARLHLRRLGREPIPRSLELRIRSLTPAEARVAVRARDGLTNRAIAQDLFVTLKTVEFHLGRIYRKLGITSRVELTERFAELDRSS
jgi:DNA-binding CsgD family transcriptional regulator